MSRVVGHLGDREYEDQIEEELDEGRALVLGRDHGGLRHEGEVCCEGMVGQGWVWGWGRGRAIGLSRCSRSRRVGPAFRWLAPLASYDC